MIIVGGSCLERVPVGAVSQQSCSSQATPSPGSSGLLSEQQGPVCTLTGDSPSIFHTSSAASDGTTVAMGWKLTALSRIDGLSSVFWV